MSQLTLAKKEALDIAEEFLTEEFRHFVELFLHPSRADLAFDLNGHPTTDSSGQRVSRYLVLDVVEAMWEFAATGIWSGGDFQECEDIFDLFLTFEPPTGLDAVDAKARLKRLIEIKDHVSARQSIDPLRGSGGESGDTAVVSRAQLAMFGGFAEETVRMALYAEDGPAKLMPQDDGTISRVEAVRWLTVKGRFQPSRHSLTHDYHPKGKLSNIMQVRAWLGVQCERIKLSEDKLPELLSLHEDDHFQAFWSERCKAADSAMPWFTPQVGIRVGEVFDIDPAWIVENLYRIRQEYELEGALQLAKGAETGRRSRAEQSIDLDSAIPVTGENVRHTLRTYKGITPHPLQRKPNAKMDGYLTAQGVSFAHEHNLKKQFVWIPEKDITEAMGQIPSERYPASEVNRSGAYGRHSGLIKYPDLATADLVRLQIRSSDDLRALLLGVAGGCAD